MKLLAKICEVDYRKCVADAKGGDFYGQQKN